MRMSITKRSRRKSKLSRKSSKPRKRQQTPERPPRRRNPIWRTRRRKRKAQRKSLLTPWTRYTRRRKHSNHRPRPPRWNLRRWRATMLNIGPVKDTIETGAADPTQTPQAETETASGAATSHGDHRYFQTLAAARHFAIRAVTLCCALLTARTVTFFNKPFSFGANVPA